MGCRQWRALSLDSLILAHAVHKAFGMILQLGAYLRMARQEALKLWVMGEVICIVRQLRMAGKLLCDLGMLVEITIIESGQRSSIIRCGVHKTFRMLRQVGPYLRMVRQEALKLWVTGEILRIIRQPG